PRLVIERDRALAENVEDLADLDFGNHLTQADGARIRHGHHDFTVGVEDTEHIKPLALPSNVLFLDADHFGHSLRGINGLVTNLEFYVRSSLHDFSFHPLPPLAACSRAWILTPPRQTPGILPTINRRFL